MQSDYNDNNLFLSHICWDITSRCNDNCTFCYSERGLSETSLDKNKQILEKLIVLNPKKISFVGGEPLLYGNKLFELIKFGKQINNNIEYSLTSNTILLFDNKLNLNIDLLERVRNHFDWLTFSLEGCNADIQSKMTRNKNHFHRIIALLEYFKTTNQKIKINTMVCKLNITNDNINKIADILIGYKVNRWKLMHFLPSRNLALENKEMYSITDYQFQKIYNKAVDYSSNKINISKNDKNDFCSYFTISANGKFINYDGKYYHEEIDFIKESNETIKIILTNLCKRFRE
jgi:MoaA/NifB/PqqE/SkfB family radical SAM enzyme